jgi:hypothetical protein
LLSSEATLVAEAGREALVVQDALERVVGLDAPAQALAEGLCADGQDHELLDVDVRVGVRSTVDDVEHRHRQNVRVRAAEVLVERQVSGVRCGLGDGERDTEDRVGAELLLVVGAVELDERRVDETLVARLEALDRRAEHVENGVDRLLDALAEVAALVAIPQLVGLECTGRCAGGNGRTRHGSVVKQHLDLDGRVAPGVENLASAYCLDFSHGWISL